MNVKEQLETGKYIAKLERENKKFKAENAVLRQELGRYRKLFSEIQRLKL